jgi:radical SAM superfamily enzyme YgiQ (UPF0313 family)
MLDIVIAITPRIVDDFGYTPAGPALLKGSLEAHGFTSKIIDFNAEIDKTFQNHLHYNAVNNFFLFNNFYNNKVWEVLGPIFEEWADQILALKSNWVGISVFSYNSHRASRLLAIAIKKKNPNQKIVLGGSGIRTDFKFPEYLYENRIIDAYIRGEGEVSLVELLKDNLDYPGINTLPPIQITNINEIPFPNYDDYELKTYTNKKGLEALPITGSRGCVRSCTFCDIAAQWPKFVYRNGNSITDEIKHQVIKYEVNAFRFTDSLINGSMKAFREMITSLADFRETLPNDRKFIWDTHFIVRSRRQMPPEDFDTMKKAGAGTMLIGIESGSPSVRDHMRKGFTDEDLEYTMEQLNRVKIKTRMLMIVGYPTETEEDFQQTLDMFTRYKPYLDNGIIEEVNLGLTLNLLPATPLYDNKGEYDIVQMNEHINDWVCKTNPTLTYKERLYRRIVLQAHCERLGYKIFEAANYTKQLYSAWVEVNKLENNTLRLIDTFKFDRDKGGLIDGN